MNRIKIYVTSIAILFTAFSCTKTSNLKLNSSGDSNNTVYYKGDPNCIYYYKGKTISSNSIPDNMETGVQYVTDKSGKLEIYVFDSEVEFKQFVSSNKLSLSETKSILAKMEKIELARKFAEDNDVISHYEKTGEVKRAYLDYLALLDKPTRGVGILFDNLNASGTWVPLTGSGQPTYGSFNDRAESATGAGLANTIYDRTFFRSPTRWLTLGTGGVINFDLAMNFQNRTASGW